MITKWVSLKTHQFGLTNCRFHNRCPTRHRSQIKSRVSEIKSVRITSLEQMLVRTLEDALDS
jgi:hypothetical protein